MQYRLRNGVSQGTRSFSSKHHAVSFRAAVTRKPLSVHVLAFVPDDRNREKLRTSVCIIGSGPAAHTAAIYTARAELDTLVFEGWMANGIAAGGQLTTTSYVENFPGFPEPIMGWELCENFRKQSKFHGANLVQETVEGVDLTSRPFQVYTDAKHVTADAVIIATGAVAKRLRFPGSGEGPDGFWNRGISACAVCDGASMRNLAVAVVGGGDAAMEEALFLTRYATEVYIIHRFDYFEASKIMSKRALSNPKIKVLWSHEVVEAYGQENLAGLKLRNNQTGELKDLAVSGLYFGIGHRPATDFLGGQVPLDNYGYVLTIPGTASTSIPGVFAAGDVQDKKYRQAITAAGSGCMAALEAERFLAEMSSPMGSMDGTTTTNGTSSAAPAPQPQLTR